MNIKTSFAVVELRCPKCKSDINFTIKDNEIKFNIGEGDVNNDE